ncbi:MarR family transcriptional regulator [Thiopseudomonas denitrificans]|uniref:MarR family transcriptional regulator n=1 Tax=Thiopseudomonas denitrificans TaxID=1501432 RepID=A0A4R6TZS0_9GAMM|nr:MarR family transcriptional regulator [Thiopseudomonas denitrificans]TDQ39480.1 MarR family transcriptional regulator [Thiopseudomonas denitrificans]
MYEKHRFAMELAHVSRAWRAELDRRLVSTGLSQARWMVLLHLIRNEGTPPTQRELADLIGIESPTLARTLDTLEGMNMVQRQSCGEDRRIKRVLLTEEAREIASEIEEISRQLRSEVFNGIADEDIELCQHVFQRVLGNLAAAAR